jgi:hypothetical protein
VPYHDRNRINGHGDVTADVYYKLRRKKISVFAVYLDSVYVRLGNNKLIEIKTKLSGIVMY